MAWVTGTATGHLDLLNKLVTFLSTNTTLVTAGQNWTVLAGPQASPLGNSEVYLRGPGLTGADQIFVNLYANSHVANDYYNISARGAAGYLSTAQLTAQPGCGPQVSMLTWNNSIKYWFIANGRRFIVVAKVSTVYESMYCGFHLPYGLPSEIPYPLIVSASSWLNTIRWSDQSNQHSSFWNPTAVGAASAPLSHRNTAGVWEMYANAASSGIPNGRTYPYNAQIAFRPEPGGSYALTPITLFTTEGGGNVWGELDGVYHVSGFSNSSENIISLAGQDYLVVQSGFRTTSNDYAAITLA